MLTVWMQQPEKQVWHISIDQNFCGSPAYKDGVLYLTTYSFYGNGELVALNTKDGQFNLAAKY